MIDYSLKPSYKVPSFTKQTPWKSGVFDFGKAMEGPTRRRWFNPGLININGKDWLVPRLAEEVRSHSFGQNSIWAFELNDDHVPQYGKQIQLYSTYLDQHFEDPRITRLSNGKIILSYTTFLLEMNESRTHVTGWYGAHQSAAVLDEDFRVVQTIDPIYGNNKGSVITNVVSDIWNGPNEKNWNYFLHDGKVHLLYNTDPHEVVEWGDGWEKPTNVYKSKHLKGVWEQYGEARGGTPPFLVGNEYWCFFHSSTLWKEWNLVNPGSKKRRYHMGACAFEAKPPFRITRITEQPILTGSQEDPWQTGNPLVVFPCGALLRDKKWFVTLGINDQVSGWIEIPHKDLLEITPKYGSKKIRQEATTAEPPEDGGDNQDSATVENGPNCGSVCGATPVESGIPRDVGNRGGRGNRTKHRRIRRNNARKDRRIRLGNSEPVEPCGTVAVI